MPPHIHEHVRLRELTIGELKEHDAGVRPLLTSGRYPLPFSRMATTCLDTRPYLITLSHHVHDVDAMPLEGCIDELHRVSALLGNFRCCRQGIECGLILRVDSFH